MIDGWFNHLICIFCKYTPNDLNSAVPRLCFVNWTMETKSKYGCAALAGHQISIYSTPKHQVGSCLFSTHTGNCFGHNHVQFPHRSCCSLLRSLRWCHYQSKWALFSLGRGHMLAGTGGEAAEGRPQGASSCRHYRYTAACHNTALSWQRRTHTLTHTLGLDWCMGW